MLGVNMVKLKAHGTRPRGHKFPLVSWIIRLMEWSDISHAVVELEGRVYHAHFNEVRYEDRKEWEKSVEIVYSYEIEIPTENYEAMVSFMDDYAGPKTGYFKKLFGIVIPLCVRRLFGKHVRNTFASGMKDGATCTQLVRFLAKRFWSYKMPDKPYPENFTTVDFIKMMEENKQ